MIDVLAHKYKDKETFISQNLNEHCTNVSDLMKSKGDKFNAYNLCALIGLYHDLGKASNKFQLYLNGKGPSEKHSLLGAKFLMDNAKTILVNDKNSLLFIHFAIYAIYFHHTGLKDIFLSNFEVADNTCDIIKKIESQKSFPKEVTAYYSNFILPKDSQYWNEINKENSHFFETIQIISCKNKEAYYFYIGLFERLLISCLFDSDWEDTSNFFSHKCSLSNHCNHIIWNIDDSELYARFKTKCIENKLSDIREEIAQLCLNKAFKIKDSNVYRLELPTGTGKTLISFRLALKIAKEMRKDKIIYVIPYNSIIEQTAKVIKDYLGYKYDNLVLEHHSSVDDENIGNYYEYRALTENWNSEIIVTTAVQYLNIFNNAKKSFNRRLCKILNSVVIFDEIQSIPKKCSQLFCYSINFLSGVMNSVPILTTATMPIYDGIKNFIKINNVVDIIKENELKKYDEFFLKRTKFINLLGSLNNHKIWNNELLALKVISIAEEMNNCMVICNTIKQVTSLFNEVVSKSKGNTDIPDILMLSTRFCPYERLNLINDIREKLINNKKIILITTPLIEAGIDIDFSTVIRYTASVDSIIQAAGRCNRNGLLKIGKVFIVDHELNNNESLSQMDEVNEARLEIENILLNYDYEHEFDDLLKIRSLFFKKYQKNNFFRYFLLNDMVSIEDLLSGTNNDKSHLLTQSFETATKKFKPIDSFKEYVVFVIFNENVKEELMKLNSSNKILISQLRKLYKYKIEMTKKEFDANRQNLKKLEKINAYMINFESYKTYKEM